MRFDKEVYFYTEKSDYNAKTGDYDRLEVSEVPRRASVNQTETAMIQNDYMGVQNGISNLGYETLRNFNETQNRISDCCCTTQRGIDGVNYNGAINTANINANTTAQTQKILDALSQNKIEALQAQVTQLQMQNAMCGVVRYPNATTYCSGSNPFGNCGCGNAI